VNLHSSFLSDINCGDEAGLGDLSSICDMLSETPKMATPLQPASVRKRRSIGCCMLCNLFLHYLLVVRAMWVLGVVSALRFSAV